MPVVNGYTQNLLLRDATAQIQQRLATPQRQMASGQKGEQFGEYGAPDTRRILSLQAETARVEAFGRTVAILQSRAQRTDLALNRIVDLATDVRDVTLSVRSGAARADLLRGQAANALKAVLGEMSAEVAGHYVLSGVSGGMAPTPGFDAVAAAIVGSGYLDDPTAPPPGHPPLAADDHLGAAAAIFDVLPPDPSLWYQGDPTAAGSVMIGDGRRMEPAVNAADPAIRTVLSGLAAIAYTDPANFATDQDYVAFLEAAGMRIADGFQGMHALVARNGLQQQMLAAEREAQTGLEVLLSSDLGGVVDADYAEIAMQVQSLQTQLEASYRLTAELRRLSLTHFL